MTEENNQNTDGAIQNTSSKIESIFSTVIANPGTVIMVVFTIIIGIVIYKGAPVLDKLADPGFARGLITFIISLATISLAFMLVCYAFSQPQEDRFKRAREVFGGLLGILGTIVGFYFGSASTGTMSIALADIQVKDAEVVTYVTGGSPPYQCRISATGKFEDTTEITLPQDINITSRDGWITYRFDKPLSGAKITIDVKDAQNHVASKDKDYIKPKKDDIKGKEGEGKVKAEKDSAGNIK